MVSLHGVLNVRRKDANEINREHDLASRRHCGTQSPTGARISRAPVKYTIAACQGVAASVPSPPPEMGRPRRKGDGRWIGPTGGTFGRGEAFVRMFDEAWLAAVKRQRFEKVG
jgi:hypothetical protein